MRFTRHAKKRAREIGASVKDVEAVIAEPVRVDQDPKGNPRYIGDLGDLRVRVVVALDDSDLIVTIHKRRS